MPIAINADFTLSGTTVTFPMNSQIDTELPITITGVSDTEVEGSEFIGASIQANAAYNVNGDANGDTTFLDLKITDGDAGRYRFYNTWYVIIILTILGCLLYKYTHKN